MDMGTIDVELVGNDSNYDYANNQLQYWLACASECEYELIEN